jgi:hypothetical protein
MTTNDAYQYPGPAVKVVGKPEVVPAAPKDKPANPKAAQKERNAKG